MKIGYLGTGSWGFCLASLLATKGYEIVSWTTKPDLVETLNNTGKHPRFPDIEIPGNIRFTTNLSEALEDVDVIVESVTAAGLRVVCEKIRDLSLSPRLFILTSKGLEQKTGYILPDVAVEVLGDEFHPFIGSISGPSYAQEVIKGLPTSVVATAFNQQAMNQVCEIFTTPTFRVYPNADIHGVSYGGALKNIIAIACGIAHGLKFGYSARAALMTRGLHEIRKLSLASGARPETMSGLAGMGDLCLTCSSTMSRNFHFGNLLAQGLTAAEALEEVGMVVEGAYTCVTALQLSKELSIPMPITEAIYQILHEGLKPEDAVSLLMQRTVKEEHL